VIRAQDAARIRLAIGQVGKSRIQSHANRGDAHLPSVIPPTLAWVDAEDRSSLTQEEVFGPVMTARPFSRMSEFISLVNSSRYGLQAGVFSQNLGQIQSLYRDLEVGGVVVNDVPTSRYDHQPYGGVKQSGQGREGVRYAMEEMCESKFLALSSTLPG
jgi:acyl-CoA reductase-like NAD-dependent aldehyde dehydrogenase